METQSSQLTTQQEATRFNELAQAEKWFDIQDELFADDAVSIEPEQDAHYSNATGKAAVRQKGEDIVQGITALHEAYTSQPLVAGNHFAVSRKIDITTEKHGRIVIDQIMLYEVRDGKIVSEQFFY